MEHRGPDGTEPLDDHDRKLLEDPEYAWYVRGNPWRPPSYRFRGTLKKQAVCSVLLFAAVWALFQWDHPSVSAGQAFVKTALSEEIRFEEAYAWYEARFGELPAFVPTWGRLPEQAEHAGAEAVRSYISPASGSIVEPFGGIRSGAGIVVKTAGASVSSMDAGLVLYAGETRETGLTIVVRHADGMQSVYGYLGEISVDEDDWVDAGQRIGAVRPSSGGGAGGLLYFAVKKGNSFVNPTDVVGL